MFGQLQPNISSDLCSRPPQTAIVSPVGVYIIIPTFFGKVFLPPWVYSESHITACYPGSFTPLLLHFRECVNVSVEDRCACRRAVVSKRVRAALLHQWLLLQAYICGDINAECWWERYVPSDSSSSYTQIDANTHTHTHTQPCMHTQWVNAALILKRIL